MTKISIVIASFLILALVAGAGAQVGSSNVSGTNESSNQTTESMQNVSGNVTDLTNAKSVLAAELVDNTSWTNLTSAPNVTADIGLELVAQNFTSPMMVASPDDGTGRLFVVDQVGVVWVVDANGTTLPEPFLDVRDSMVELRPAYDERGLLSIAFHPNFSENGKVYAFYSAPLRQEAPEGWNCTNHISEFQVDPGNPNQVNPTSENVLMYIDKPYQNHNGGQLVFSPADGYLYVALGDGGRANDVGNAHTPGIGNGQDLTKIYGKILRIDVDNVTAGNLTTPQNVTPTGNQTENAGVNRTENPPEPTWTTFAGSLYGIPADNPFAENRTEILDTYAYDSVPPEIYAYGFRNPAYMSFDSGGNNALFVADAGQNLFEEVDVVYNGGNYGWNIREGTHCFDPNATTDPPESCNVTGYLGEPLIGPIFEGGRDLGIVVVGGNVYRGTAVPELEGKYVFGYWSDSRTVGNGTLLVATPPEGWIAPESAANLTADANAMWEVQPVNITGGENETLGMFLRGFGEDAGGDLYVLTNDVGGPDNATSTGRVWRVVAPAPTSTIAPTPTVNVTPTPTTNLTPGATVNIVAQDFAFDTETITVPVGAEVTMVFDNRDQGIPHNVAVYDSSLRAEQIFVGDIITGPAETTYTFTAPSEPGTYYFQCDVHPDMNGEFIVE
ncbi:dehydrogenase, PQQ-dependent, s-GDH family [Methanoculleus chikugoensis]|uniref:Dehydrogenase, PQQ-dependent, s-GDH family n=1 Tax=Methanoculleus chikugoensis TaxID=118126 RepID=A0A1M4MMP9_9EURY|nr:PQQ-dependent sugar dehydrogenase [Methanoculleus chikugoensis]MDD4567922.1 PQQ-dependent sugar dehydrogenase [Methanoculleus chikugoensis]NMA11223.1 plastocyanin [Methanomicrobiales archaeon]SCL76112.1 dehydrogenase, PQQ-dependent, s-GDH family [Methanoculleus chikugoensis]